MSEEEYNWRRRYVDLTLGTIEDMRREIAASTNIEYNKELEGHIRSRTQDIEKMKRDIYAWEYHHYRFASISNDTPTPSQTSTCTSTAASASTPTSAPISSASASAPARDTDTDTVHDESHLYPDLDDYINYNSYKAPLLHAHAANRPDTMKGKHI
jgi:hypothetical protein